MHRAIAAIVLAVAMPALAAAPDTDKSSQLEKVADPGDKMICKRFAETGSLVSTYRQCKTKREWEQSRANTGSMNAINSCALSGQQAGC